MPPNREDFGIKSFEMNFDLNGSKLSTNGYDDVRNFTNVLNSTISSEGMLNPEITTSEYLFIIPAVILLLSLVGGAITYTYWKVKSETTDDVVMYANHEAHLRRQQNRSTWCRIRDFFGQEGTSENTDQQRVVSVEYVYANDHG